MAKTVIEIPVSIGDTIFIVPSEVNFKLNIVNKHEECNRIYEQTILSIQWWSNDRYCLITCDGVECHNSDSYGETWFVDRELAKWKLDRLKESS